ncbi:hypothetical protein QBC38DRAFT_447020 [Podospora fimiseda]|uniref:Nephrocystin 3-like N-terminal domain-containing protein n=1 Tax=Podospora fimiseda TaxID=252190 RepID=A0AAN7GVT2_9PEZI|nr:hypothetical protein QBC38DRAFT_447020 [Podospora fimiseda]
MASRYNDIHRPTAGTCEWLLRHETYRMWTKKRGILWIEGKPGSGKSVLLRHELDHRKRQQRTGLLLSHFFHGRGVELQRTAAGVYRALLFQLLNQSPHSAPPEMINIFNQRPKLAPGETESWTWALVDLKRYFNSALVRALAKASVTIYIDAIDEAGQEAAKRLMNDFQVLLGEIPAAIRPRLGLCFTSRSYPGIKMAKALLINVERESHGDIATYAQKRLSRIQDPHRREELLRAVVERQSGDFLWVSLVTDLLLRLDMEGIGLDHIFKRLKAVPDQLFPFYNQLIRSSPQKIETLKLMQWLACSMRPLTLGELRWAMVIDPTRQCPNKTLRQSQDASDWPGEPEKLQRRIRAISRGLAEVVVRPEGRIVQFIHQSVKDFFTNPRGGLNTLENIAVKLPFHSHPDPLGRAHHNISRTCIRYFLMNEIVRINTLTPSKLFKQQFGAFVFLRYALEFCFEHARQAEIRGTPQDDFLTYFNYPKSLIPIKTWARLCSIDRTKSDKVVFIQRPNNYLGLVPQLPYKTPRTQSQAFLMLLVLARAGIAGPFIDVFNKMKEKQQKEPRDDFGNTSFITASAHAVGDSVGWVLDRFLEGRESWDRSFRENVHLNAANVYGRRAIHEAAMRGQVEVVKKILEHFHLERQRQRYESESSKKKDVKTEEIDVLPPCKRGIPPFLYAVLNGHESILVMFLNDCLRRRKVDFLLGWRNARGQNLLMLAAERGWKIAMEAINRMLGPRGNREGYLNEECFMGRTALWYAMKGRKREVFREVFDIGKGDTGKLMGSGRRWDVVVKDGGKRVVVPPGEVERVHVLRG